MGGEESRSSEGNLERTGLKEKDRKGRVEKGREGKGVG